MTATMQVAVAICLTGAIATATYSCYVQRRPKPGPSDLQKAVDKAWSADGKKWRGADFKRPKGNGK